MATVVRNLRWRLSAVSTALRMKPMRGGADDDDGGEGDEGAAGSGDAGTGSEDAGKAGDDAGKGKDGDDTGDGEGAAGSGTATSTKTADEYRQELRRYERSAKTASAKKDKELAKLREQLKEREDADKSEQEKAVEKAREAGKQEATVAAEKERRQDRLEVAATRLASKGLVLGEGDDAKTVKFADPEDALVHLERAIAREEVDVDELFDDKGHAKPEALRAALVDLLEQKPHLRERDGDGPQATKPPAGSSDAGKGADGKKSLEEMSVEDQYQRIRRHKG